MQRLLKLTNKALRSGVARSQYDDRGGAWQSAIGLNPFLSDDASRFLLATTATPTRIAASSFTDIPLAYAVDSTTGSGILYMLGSGGRFYSMNSSNSVTVIRPGASVLTALTNATGGMALITDSASNRYLFMCLRQALVRWDLNTADDASHWNTGNPLFSSNFHPMHRNGDTVYFGNGNYLGSIPLGADHSQATTFTNVNFQLINFGTNTGVTAIGDDGRYTLIATSPNVDDTTSVTSEARVVWYPNIGINWDWEVTFKGERVIRAIVRNSLGVFALGEQTIYQIAFGTQPKLLRTFDTADAAGGAFNAIATGVGPRVNIARPFGDSLIFGKRGAVFGKRYPTEGVTFSHPLQGHTSDISMIVPDFQKSTVYVGTEDSKFWVYDMTLAGNTANTYTTRWLDLAQHSVLQRLEIDLPAGIAASDVTGITITNPAGQSVSASLSQATVSSGKRNYLKVKLKPELQAAKVKFAITHSAGAPKLGDLTLYGVPTIE